MLINVPQYIDVEDKIIGPITAKQLGWLMGLGGLILVMYTMLDKMTLFLIGIPVSFLFIALAFYRPYGQTFLQFIINGFFYFFRPKIFIWKRTPEKIQNIIHTKKTENFSNIQNQKKLTSQELESLAGIIDTRGSQSNEHILEIIRKAKLKNK
jgi:hypothetical protein